MKAEDFTRNRSLTFTTLTIFIINFVKKSLQLELYNLTDLLTIPSVTKQAFSKARKKLSPMVFQLLNKKLLEEFYSDNLIKRFKGLRILAIDGSTLRLPDSAQLYERYGRDIANSSIPLAKASIMFDVLNQLTLHAGIVPYATSERSLAFDHIHNLDKNTKNEQPFTDLLMFDRGYPSRFLMFLLNNCKKHFLMRMQEASLSEMLDAVRSGKRDSIITIPAFKHKSCKANTEIQEHLPNLSQDAQLEIRVLVFDLSSGQREIIATSLLDSDNFGYEDIFRLYGMRWDIEECYKFYKSIAEIQNFSGKSVIAIEQDFYATIFSCNLSALLMQEAQDELNESAEKKNLIYEYKINRNILIGVIKNEIIEIFLNNRDLGAYCESLKNRIKKNLVPIRPGRKFQRKFKRVKSAIDRRAL